jgi:hypothetical protein
MYEKTYTKKELAHQFNINLKTVTETIKHCGLSTSQTRYTEEEINSRFIPARRLMETGQATTYEELEEHFSMRSAEAHTDDVRDTEPRYEPQQQRSTQPNPMGSNEFLDEVHQEITRSFEVMVESAILDVVQRLPQIAMRAASSARTRGELRRVFSEARSQFTNSPPTFKASDSPAALPEGEEGESSQTPDVLVGWEEEETPDEQGASLDAEQPEADEISDDNQPSD